MPIPPTFIVYVLNALNVVLGNTADENIKHPETGGFHGHTAIKILSYLGDAIIVDEYGEVLEWVCGDDLPVDIKTFIPLHMEKIRNHYGDGIVVLENGLTCKWKGKNKFLYEKKEAFFGRTI